MNQSAWVDPKIDRVTVANARAYLLNRGWRLQPFPGPELLVFEGPNDDDGEPIIQVLPSSERLRDYRIRLEDLIGALSVIENRPAADVLTDLLGGTRTIGSAAAPRRWQWRARSARANQSCLGPASSLIRECIDHIRRLTGQEVLPHWQPLPSAISDELPVWPRRCGA